MEDRSLENFARPESTLELADTSGYCLVFPLDNEESSDTLKSRLPDDVLCDDTCGGAVLVEVPNIPGHDNERAANYIREALAGFGYEVEATQPS